MFAAGLLLGFSLFVEESYTSTRNEIADSYNSCCAVLRRFSRLSPQAGHYYDILMNLADAISTYREQLQDEKRRTGSKYINRIFSITDRQQADEEVRQEEPYQSPISGSGGGDTVVFGHDLADQAFLDVNDAANLGLWDDLSLEYQPFGMFF